DAQLPSAAVLRDLADHLDHVSFANPLDFRHALGPERLGGNGPGGIPEREHRVDPTLEAPLIGIDHEQRILEAVADVEGGEVGGAGHGREYTGSGVWGVVRFVARRSAIVHRHEPLPGPRSHGFSFGRSVSRSCSLWKGRRGARIGSRWAIE